MSDATTQRVTTERARELLAGATPGPWRAGLARTIISIRSAARGICGISVSALHVYIDDRDGFIREQRANAALIAAAPDLAADLIAARERIAALEAERDEARRWAEAAAAAENANAAELREARATLDAIAALVGPGDVVERVRALVVAVESREYADRVTP